MNLLIKRTFLVVGVSLLVLFLTGIFLPMLISTNTLPVTIILVIATTAIACGFISIAFVIKKLWVFSKLNETDDYDNHIC